VRTKGLFYQQKGGTERQGEMGVNVRKKKRHQVPAKGTAREKIDEPGERLDAILSAGAGGSRAR